MSKHIFVRYERIGNPKVPEGFTREPGFDGKTNAYGTVVAIYRIREGFDLFETLPVICGHGGSMWLCSDCADRTMEGKTPLYEPPGFTYPQSFSNGEIRSWTYQWEHKLH